MVINNGFNILPWYDSLEKQSNKKWYAFGQSWPLACPQDTILPFQFVSSESISIKSALTAVNLTTGVETNLGITPTVIEGSQANANYYIVKQSEAIMKATLQVGRYYFKMNTDKGTLYSEEVVVVDNISDYIKLEYWNEDTLNFMSGEINFADSFKFVLYIPSTIGKPEYEFEEELTKRLGYKFIESQTSNKLYKFNFLAPEYICDALRLVRMCDYIKFTTKFDTYNALSFSYEPKWQDAGYLAAIDVEFDTDCIIQKLESFNRRAKDSFYNALLAEIDEPVLFSPDTVAQYYTEFTSAAVVNGKLIRQLELINEVELRSDFDNIVLPIDNQADPSQKAKKITLTALQKKIGDDRYLRKDQDDRSKGKIASDKAIEVGEYVAGVRGAIVYKDLATGQTVAELDKLYVRMKAYFETLEIINTNSIGGKQILSPAGAITCIGVDELDTCYRCYFLAEQDGTEVENRWKKDDQAYSKSFNVKTGVTENASSQMYWRLVDAIDESPVEYNGKMCHYIDLSITDCIADSGIPKSGDIINQRGNRTDIDRQNFVEMSSVDAFSPSVTLYHGVNEYSLENKEMVQFGVDKTTGKAFMHVYGSMYVGARDESSFLRYTPEKGVELKCTLSVGTKLSDGRDLEDTLKDLSPEGYDALVKDVKDLSGKVDEFGTDLETVKQQSDRQYTIWFFNYEPTLYNEPASKWDTPELKAEHDQDMFYYRDAGKAWRFENGKWESITDQDTIRALELIASTRKEVDDMSYLKTALQRANPTVIENGLVMSTVVAVQNQGGEVEAFINGSDLAEDDSHGKLLLAGGIPEEGGTLEERSKKALTRIYEDGTLYASKGVFGGFIRSEFALVTACDAISVSPLYNDRAWKLGNVLYVDATFEEVVLPCGDEYAGARVIIMDTYFIKSRMATYPTVIRTEDGNGILCGILSTDDKVSPNDIPAIMIDCGAVEFVYKYIKKEDDTFYQRWVLISSSCATIEVFK